jgi:hypothetical protein
MAISNILRIFYDRLVHTFLSGLGIMYQVISGNPAANVFLMARSDLIRSKNVETIPRPSTAT